MAECALLKKGIKENKMLLFIAFVWAVGFVIGTLGFVNALKDEPEEPYNAHDSDYRI